MLLVNSSVGGCRVRSMVSARFTCLAWTMKILCTEALAARYEKQHLDLHDQCANRHKASGHRPDSHLAIHNMIMDAWSILGTVADSGRLLLILPLGVGKRAFLLK
jgi:hypothetical protein